jgi:hypothetical protein
MTLFHSIISQNSGFAHYTPETSRTLAKPTGLDQYREPVLPSVGVKPNSWSHIYIMPTSRYVYVIRKGFYK